jgi:Peroxisomal biogenesis factor 11 (PEX11)
MSRIVKQLVVIDRIISTTDGRDKSIKVVQYLLKVIKFNKTTVSHLSLARKIIRIAHFLQPLNNALSTKALASGGKAVRLNFEESLDLLNNWLSALNDISDDLICLAKIGFLATAYAKTLTPISNNLWLATILLDLRASAIKIASMRGTKTKTSKTKEDEWKEIMAFTKLGCDLVFCIIDVMEYTDEVSQHVQTATGLTAALLGTYKIYNKLK